MATTEVWTVADAKARFSEVIDRALSEGPQTITRNGKQAVVVVASEEWERKTKRRGNLAEFFAASPLRDSGLAVERPTDGPRETEL
jgi:prevent-host-death family protein